jgi:hypothetical protein
MEDSGRGKKARDWSEAMFRKEEGGTFLNEILWFMDARNGDESCRKMRS